MLFEFLSDSMYLYMGFGWFKTRYLASINYLLNAIQTDSLTTL